MGIYTKVADPAGDKWIEIGASAPGLPGVGGWATITAVSGTYTQPRYEYTDADGMDWIAYEWTDDGTITTSDGLVDALIVGAGGPTGGPLNYTYMGYGGAGGVHAGAISLNGNSPINVQVGQPTLGYNTLETVSHSKVGIAIAIAGGGGVSNNTADVGGDGGCGGGGTSVSTIGVGIQGGNGGYGTRPAGGGAGGDANGTTAGPGRQFAYTSNTPKMYAVGGSSTTPNTPNTGNGCGGTMNTSARQPGSSGVVIIRVPKEYAQGVAETFHGWDSFALVTDGVVTEVKRVPDNEPHTLDAEWLPCDAEVQAGWSHADGEFTPPPAPTRDDLIAELKERIKDLQKDK